MKKVLMLLMSLVIATSFVVAGGTTESSIDENTRVIEFWHTMTGVNATATDKIAEDFNATIGKEKGIYVKSVYQGNDNSEKLKTLAQAGDKKNFPDVAMIVGAGIPSAVTYDSLVPVDDLFAKGSTLVEKEDLMPNLVRAFSYKNKMIGMPVNCSALILYYNKDMFDEAGIAAPPATIAEMAEDIEKLTITNGNEIERYGLNVALRRYQMANFIGGQGEYNFFGDNEGGRTAPMTKVTFGEDGSLRAFLQEWEKVVKTGGYKAYEDDINEEFALQLHAMVIMSTARIGKIQALVGENFDWGVAPLPKVNDEDTGGVAVGGSCVVIFDPDNDPEQVDAAWEFVQYMASPEVQYQFHKDTGYIPVNNNVYTLDGVDEHFAENPAYKVAIDALYNSNPNVQEPFDIINWEIDAIFREHLLNFANGTESLDECHDNIVNECNDKLDAYHRAND